MGWFAVPPLGLTRAERTALFAGVLLMAAFFVSYFGYVLVGHPVLRVFYRAGVTTRNVADLTDWLGRGDRAFDYFLARRLLVGAGLGVMLVCWSMRRTGLFEDLRAFWRVIAGVPKAVFIGLLGLLVAGHVWLLRLGFPLVSIVEALSPLVLVSRPFRVVFFVVMIPFHLMTLTLMEVSFLENLLLYVVLVDFSRWLPVLALGGLDSHDRSSLRAVGSRRLVTSETP